MEEGTSDTTQPTMKDDGNWHIVDKYEDALLLVQEYKTRTVTQFAVVKADKDFGNIDIHSRKHRIRFTDDCIEFDGTPFVIVGMRILDCQHGRDRHSSEKEKRISKGAKDVKNQKVKSQRKTKKLGCQSQIKMKEIIRFPQFKIKTNQRYYREKASNMVHAEIKKKSAKLERKFMVYLPSVSSHENHETGDKAGSVLSIDERLVSEIYANAGSIQNVNAMRQLLHRVVTKKIFNETNVPPATNRSFFPTPKTIRNIMQTAIKKVGLSKIEQECLLKKIDEWKARYPEDEFYCRPKGSTTSYPDRTGNARDTVKDNVNEDDEIDFKPTPSATNSFMFIYQSKYMKRLLSRYGNEMVFLDAAYKTQRYYLPLYFLVVKTNVGYQVVATFVCEGKTTDIIAFAVEKVKEWNPSWEPFYAMVDGCEEEIQAFERIFPNCEVYICDFHREQAWERWLNITQNGARDIKAEMLCKFCRIARARNENELQQALDDLRNCAYWNNGYDNMVNWFEKQWLPLITRWCWLYRMEHLMVILNSNNGVEMQNKTFKHPYLNKHRRLALSSMMTVLIEEYFVDSYKSYCDANTPDCSNSHRHSKVILNFLHNRPQDFVKHCMERIKLVKSSDLTDITCNGIGSFSFGDIGEEEYYQLHFGDEMSNTMPKCTCTDWEKNRFPCKHFFAVMEKFPSWSFRSFPAIYKNSVFLTLDRNIIPILLRKKRDIHHPTQSLPDNMTLEDNIPLEDNITFETEVDDSHEKASQSNNNNAPIFREEWKRIQDLSFVTNFDNDLFERAMPLVRSLANMMRDKVSVEDSLVVVSSGSQAKQKKSELRKTPLRKKRGKFVNSHGEGAQKAKKARILNSNQEGYVEEEIAWLDFFVNDDKDKILTISDTEFEAVTNN